MTTIDIRIPSAPDGSYTVTVGSGFLDTLWDRIEADFPGSQKFLVTDDNLVAAGHVERLLGNRDICRFVISPAGEKSKNAVTLGSILDSMEKAYLGRDGVIVAVGGGTVGDIAGFAAGVFKRGVPVVQIPTTTVGQADSAIGGKTGIDSSLSKNAYGVFHHPAAVYIDTETLKTLDEANYRAGLAESVKHALIADAEYFVYLEQNLDAILARDGAALERMALANCRIKASVVEADPYERNLRSVLNYGHTIGHAVEAASGYRLLHGEAVSIGMVAAGLLEIHTRLGSQQRLQRVRDILAKMNLPLKLPPDIAEKTIMDHLRRDKKAVDAKARFVLLKDIGVVNSRDGRYAVRLDETVVQAVLRKLC